MNLRRTLMRTGMFLFTALPVAIFGEDSGAAAAAARLDESNRKMLLIAFLFYGVILGAYLVWSETRLRRLESAKK